MNRLALNSAVLALFSLGTLVLASGCEDESFVELDKLSLSFTPDPVVFPSTSVGSTSRTTVVIRNLSKDSPVTFSLELAEDQRAQDREREFWLVDTNSEFTIQPGFEVYAEIEYAPTNEIADSGVLRAISPSGNVIGSASLTTGEVTPDIDGPSRVLTGRVPAGETGVRDFFIQNVGLSDLQVTDASFGQENEEFDFCLLVGEGDDQMCTGKENVLPAVLKPYERIDVRLSYTPTDDSPDTIDFVVESDDPDENPFIVEISANGADPCITVTDESGLDFGASFIGGRSQRTMTISNCSSTETLDISSLGLSSDTDSEFSLEPSTLPELPAVIETGSSTSIVVNYDATGEVSNRGTIVIESNDTAKSPLRIPLAGSGTFDQCPETIATASVPGVPAAQHLDVSPLETVQFDGSRSNGGQAATYQWSIIESPPGSNSTFDDSTAARPEFFVDLAGSYRFQLEVYNQNGTRSCAPAEITLLATPQEAIHVQLVWDSTADLDLHFKQGGYDWEDPIYDVYYNNEAPNWGNSHPSLDIDDTDGHGPENVNLDDPTRDGYYHIGVYVYYEDITSNATVRVYFDGQEVWEHDDKFLGACDNRGCDLWHVANIDWQQRRVVSVDRVTIEEL